MSIPLLANGDLGALRFLKKDGETGMSAFAGGMSDTFNVQTTASIEIYRVIAISQSPAYHSYPAASSQYPPLPP